MSTKRRLRWPRPFSIAAVATWSLVACSSSSRGPAPNSNARPSVASTNAAACPMWRQPLDAYGGPTDVEHEGEMGSFKFILTNVEPPTPDLGTITWTIKLVDAAGQPVKDATFPVIRPWMPAHTHGTTALPVLTNHGDGTYTIDNLYLYMKDVWQVTLEAKSGATTDTAVFTFCLGT